MTLDEDKAVLMNALMDTHTALAVHLKDRCSLEVELNGVPVKVDLTDAINFAIGVEMGVTMGLIMQATERKQFVDLGQRSMTRLQSVLGDYVETKMGAKK